jgi:hypothetical protein
VADLIGLWAQATLLHWFGLTWHNSWPIVLIFIGLRVLVTEMFGKGRDPRCPVIAPS